MLRLTARYLLALVLGLAPLALLSAETPSAPPPNVLLIYTDDHGYADLGAQGVDLDIRTPHLDQLARDGVRFTRGYVTGPQCVPSRAGVITGIHQNRFGVDDNTKGPLPLGVLTLPERLRQRGYVSGMSGKWHLDLGFESKGQGKAQRVDPRYLPHAHGFDEYWCGSLRQYHASHALDGTAFTDAPRLVTDPRFRITVQTEAALAFLDRRSRSPDQLWFLYLPWFAPHVPLESPEPWFSRTPAHLPLPRRQALAMIAALDDGLGQIRARLETLGQTRRTLVFFISDNGAPLRSTAWDGSLNTPLVGEKGMLTDGGIRVPFLAAWPGTLPAGATYDHPVSALDVAATAVARAGADATGLDGVDLLPHLTGDRRDTPPHELLFWRWRSQAAVLEFPWKLIHLGHDQRFLFKVTEPGGETRNLLDQHPDIATRLDTRLRAWQATLHRPGPPEPLNAQDQLFFDDHVLKNTGSTRRAPTAAKGKAQASDTPEWQARGGTLRAEGDLLRLTPDSAAKAAFITRSQLRIAGPAVARITLKTPASGPAAIAWRTADQPDFIPANRAAFDIPASTDWQTHTVPLPAQGRIIHVRIHLPAGPAELRPPVIEPAR